MTITTPNYFKLVLALLCLFFLGTIYGQNQDKTPKKIFGKTVKAGSINPIDGRIRCATNEYEQFLQEKNSKRMSSNQFETWLAPLVSKYKANRAISKTAGIIITIPVVVHVIYNGQALGVAPNIVDAQVQSQITVLNQDFRKLIGTNGYNTNSDGADVGIQFELAKQDPNGNPTNGIDRRSLCQTSWAETEIEGKLKPLTIWDPTKYLNMWSLKFTDSTLLGYAQFPDGSGLPGLDTSGGSANTDGVVSNYNVFGSKPFDTNNSFLLDPTYNQGRTMTHEVGHWLGLKHIWGDSTCGDDYCADTPVHHDANYNCPTPIPMSCDNLVPEMIQNYMDYTNDACMNIFTLNQKDRITTIMNNAARRTSLRTSTKHLAIPLFANDAEVKLEGSCPASSCGAVFNQTTQKITIYNRGTNNLTAATVNYNINGGSNTVYNWSGNLAINAYASFDVTINATSNGTLNANIAFTNGGADQRVLNNTASGVFTLPVAPANYTYTSYKFRLQQDLWGSETTWDLKNSSGTTIYSGGPYSDKSALPLPALISSTWTLTNNQCYTFTINDSAGDGLCCTDGNGYYDIKTNSGSVIVKSGAAFTSSESVTFTTNTLATEVFENSNDVFLYPNPTKNILNIRVSNNFGLPNNYTIYNNLGQIISQKNISSAADLTINTSLLNNGIYYINIEKEGKNKSLPFIKE
jgi:hypothetical protein